MSNWPTVERNQVLLTEHECAEMDRVLAVLGSRHMTSREIADAADMTCARARIPLARLSSAGILFRTGDCSQGDPARYYFARPVPAIFILAFRPEDTR